MMKVLRLFFAIVASLVLGTAASAADGAADAERTFSSAEVQADFDELYRKLQESHHDLYVRRAKPEYDAKFKTMRAAFDRPLALPEVESRFQEFVAYGRVAHSVIQFPWPAYGSYRSNGGKVFPLRFRVVNGRAYVIENHSGLTSIALGDEIVSLNSEPITTWIARLGAHVSADTEYFRNTLLEHSFTGLLWRTVGATESFRLQLRNASGTLFDVVVPARTTDEMDAAAKRQPPPANAEANKRTFRMLENGVAYLRPGPFYNNEPGAYEWDAASFKTFIDSSFKQVLQAKAAVLLVDLRDNPGGDNSFSDLLVSWFADRPYRFASKFRIKVSQAAIDSNQYRVEKAKGDEDAVSLKLAAAYRGRALGEMVEFEIPLAQPRSEPRFHGNVFLLINRHSFSNTVMVAALTQDYGFGKVLGEETSDLSASYGAMESFKLTKTGISVGFPKAHIIRPNGSEVPRGVVPDFPIEEPIVQTTEDEMLRRAIDLAAKAAAEPTPGAKP